ncbi:hypothetical protein ABOONEI_2101 [Aciduliprofundum boonei T469]|nr:hypothetical protein ABOONEI_2101 [Aciduliprofundum boonei T469]
MCLYYVIVVVKDKIGRRRYILLKNEPKIRKLINEIRKIDSWAKIVYYDDNFAILRCRHWYKDDILEILHNNGIKTYRTSGTIKKTKRIMQGIKP